MTDAAAGRTDQSLADEFFDRQHRHDPLNATLLGLTGFDGLLPDLRRSAEVAAADAFRRIARAAVGSATTSDPGGGDRQDRDRQDRDRQDRDRQRVDAAVLTWMANAAADDAQHCLWEANASAAGYVSPQALVFQAVPATPLPDDTARLVMLDRLAGLADHFDAVADRYRQAAGVGRVPTAVGVRQAARQLETYLGRPVEQDVLLPAALGARRAEAAVVVEQQVRPAMVRLAQMLRGELLPVARGDDDVGIGAVPGGADGYRAAVARHTSLASTPEQIHQTGLDVLEELREQWTQVGRQALDLTDPGEIRARLRTDPALRFQTREQIVATVTEALDRAEAHRADMLPPFDIGGCVVEEIDPAEAASAPLAYYRPPSDDGTRPGAHCVLTADPGDRYRFEYEALAFHESVPGHHLQLASAQTLDHLPRYRRHVDAQLGVYVEGWGLYAERLADEFGLYSSPLARLGMLSFDALRACRLVVDTGMHALGWSRTRAMDFLRDNTATPEANVRNEIDRYIASPGQALAYMTGRREIQRLRRRCEAELGAAFDLAGFHGAVLGEGPLPMPVLDTVVAAWSRTRRG